MTSNDLYELNLYAGFPAEHRLRALLEAHVSGEDHDQRILELSQALGYTRPEVVRLWTTFRARIPLEKLPGISRFIGVHLSVLVALWLAEYSSEALAEELFKAASPLVTEGEMAIIETARAAYQDEADDQLEP